MLLLLPQDFLWHDSRSVSSVVANGTHLPDVCIVGSVEESDIVLVVQR
jgi:hypothetical protein